MKNMKKLLGAMAALGFSTVAAVNVVACSSPAASNDLTKSFEASYNTAAADATAQGKWGLAPSGNDFTFTFASVDATTLTALVKPKADAPVTLVTKEADKASFPNATKAGEELAQITKNTADGKVTASGDKKTVAIKFTLKLWKATEASKTGDNWVVQSTTMDVTVNVDTAASETKVNLNTVTTIEAPAKVIAATPNATTKAELVTALDSQVLAAVDAVASGVAKTTDYTYDITKDNGDAITTIDLSAAGVKVKVTITAVDDSKKVTGASEAIEITLPIATTS